MNKPKAPMDMSVEAFIDLVEKRYHTEEPTNMNAWINTLRMIAEEPAPNPFTPDQLAWMREEQRNDYRYATIDRDGAIWTWEEKPERKDLLWRPNKNGLKKYGHMRFLKRVLSWDDSEPLCFADYAPLEGAADV